MKNTVLLLITFWLCNIAFSQQDVPPVNGYQAQFEQAYIAYPSIPRGILESVAFCNTRFTHITHNAGDPESCVELPKAYGVMGLTLDGKNYFRNNLTLIATLSGYTEQSIINDPAIHIQAYAKAYNNLLESYSLLNASPENQLPVLISLSELPDSGLQNDFALNSQLYSIFAFLNTKEYQVFYQFPEYNIDLKSIFGENNYKILSSPSVIITGESVNDLNGNQYQKSQNNNSNANLQSVNYASALWNPAASCNYSSRNGTAISAITIHTVQGSYASCISWFKNCNANVSAHYVVRSSDGQITQMVNETKKAWHVGNHNPYTIGIEHEGYIADATWYTNAMYVASANLSRDITQSGYGILPTSCYNGPSCTGTSNSCGLSNTYKIKGHQHYSSQSHTDPGINWDWPKYYCLINNCNSGPTNLSVSTSTNCGNPSVTLNWANNASNWNIDITTNSNWNSWNVKFGINGTSTTAPAGFSGGLILQPGVTYYWRIFDGTNFTYGPSFTVPNCAPLGNIDVANCNTVDGWAFDPNYTNQSINVKVYIDGAYIATVPTTVARPDVNSAHSITGVHGFSWILPASFQDNNSHQVKVYAVNVPTGSNTLIGTKTIVPCAFNLTASDTAICEGDSIVLSWTNSGNGWYVDVSSDSTFSGGYSYKIVSNGTATVAPSGFTPALTLLPNTTYYWRVWNAAGVHTYAAVPFKVNPKPSNPVVTAADSICPGISTTIAAGGSTGGTVSYNFFDAASGGTLLGQNAITVNPIVSTTYYLEAINEFGCRNSAEHLAIPVIVKTAPTNPLVTASSNTICLGDTVMLNASGATGGTVTYNFYSALNGGILFGTAPLMLAPVATTSYYLEAINEYGCVADTGRIPVVIVVNALPVTTLSNDAVTVNSIFEGQELIFTATTGFVGYTFFIDSVAVQTGSSNTFTTDYLQNQQEVAVVVTDINGCKSSYENSMNIEVKPRSNAFTPNGDGMNDLFLNGLEITIVNRWGMLLFEGKSGWNGTYKGEQLPAGTYFYTIKLNNPDNNKVDNSGPVTLIR